MMEIRDLVQLIADDVREIPPDSGSSTWRLEVDFSPCGYHIYSENLHSAYHEVAVLMGLIETRKGRAPKIHRLKKLLDTPLAI